MAEMIPEDQVKEILLEYECARDGDIENFLQHKALTYERRGWCSTYVLMNEEQLRYHHAFSVSGYFTLSNKVLQLSDTISFSRRKRLFNGLKKADDHMHSILIGQLGKYIGTGNRDICQLSAGELLDRAFEIIYQVKARIVCNCFLIECKDEKKIRNIYEEYGFRELQKERELIQYFKII